MNVKPNPEDPAVAGHPSRNAARSAATRGSLIAAARGLFAARGFNAVGTEEIVRAAGVTRGALYHHFRDKEDLFLAVYEEVERDLTARVAEQALGAGGPWEVMERGAQIFLDACQEPEVQRVALVDAPAVLGWDGWRSVGERHALGLVQALIEQAIADGEIDRQPPRALALLLIGAIDEAALMVARAEDFAAARAEIGEVVSWMLRSLRRAERPTAAG